MGTTRKTGKPQFFDKCVYKRVHMYFINKTQLFKHKGPSK